MMYYEFIVGDETYKLRLTTRSIVGLEKVLGSNPLSIFGKGDRIPTLTEMVNVLHASLQPLNHSITINNAYDIFDKWIEDGHTMTDFIPIIVEIYKVSGVIEDNEKN